MTPTPTARDATDALARFIVRRAGPSKHPFYAGSEWDGSLWAARRDSAEEMTDADAHRCVSINWQEQLVIEPAPAIPGALS